MTDLPAPGNPTAPSPPTAPVPDIIPATAGPFLGARLAASSEKLATVVPRVLAAGDDEAVHDLRVALRRTRTVLEVGRSVLGPFHADEVRRALKHVQQETGILRDEEVLLELVSKLPIDPAARPAVEAWLAVRRRHERRLRGVLRRTVQQGEVDRGRRLLDALLAFRVNPSRDKRLTKFARRAVEDARRAVDKRRAAAADDELEPLDQVEALHELRIACKRLRYTVETFAPALPDEWAAIGKQASRFQSRLGALHDTDMALARVRAARSLPDGARGELLAALARVREERSASFEEELGSASFAPAAPAQAVGAVSLRKISTR